jgi:hypothetical protein
MIVFVEISNFLALAWEVEGFGSYRRNFERRASTEARKCMCVSPVWFRENRPWSRWVSILNFI